MLRPGSAGNGSSSGSNRSSTNSQHFRTTQKIENEKRDKVKRSKDGQYNASEDLYEVAATSTIERPKTLFYSRPSEYLSPEREPIQFDVNLVGAPVEVEQLVNSIKRVAEQFLYHWKTFPIVLPTPISIIEPWPHGPEGGSLGRKTRHLHLRDLFIAPSFDELDAVAVDGKGEPRRLTGKQLESLRERGLHKDKFGKPKLLSEAQLENIRLEGEFSVDSINFPGQQHTWRLSQLLQKGVEKTQESLMDDLALAFRFIFVTARNRLSSHFFSVSEGITAFTAGWKKIFDILFGIPSLLAHNLDQKIREERCKYLVTELICKPEFDDAMDILCAFIRKQLRRATTEKFEVVRECSQPPVAVPYQYVTPTGLELDLRLWDRGLMRKALPILAHILEREARGWFLHFRERLIADLKAQKKSDQDIEKEANEAVMRNYLNRVYNSILSHPDLIALGPGIPQLLVNQAESVVLMHKAVQNVQRQLAKEQEELGITLAQDFPILSRIEPWLRENMRIAELRFATEKQWCAHEEAIGLCSSKKLTQAVYFLSRDLAFMKEREPALLRELRKVKNPTRVFQWATQIWLPSKWIVRRNFQGTSEIVPTVLSNQSTSITTPRSDPSQPVFLVEKEHLSTTTTRWPLWRWFNYVHRTWCWTWNAMFFFGIVLPWCSPVGVRALFCLEPFMPDLELSQVNGTLFPRKSSLTQTLTSRLLSLWRHISKSRTRFETEPDTGFIGKGFTRHVDRFWNYIVKGLFGTIAIVVLFPVLCLLVIASSLAVAASAVLWMPLLTLGLQVSNALIYDVDTPSESRNRYCVLLEAVIWNILLQGILQPLAAVFVAAVLCPLVTLVICTVGVSRYCLRLVWDALVFHLLIKKRGRIPASDSFVVKRIAGPGLTDNYYFQIRPEQALAAFEAQMELYELSVYERIVENTIQQPQKDYAQFVEACFGPFSAQLSKVGPFKILEKESQQLLTMLQEKVEKRRRDLQTGLNSAVKGKIKMNMTDLKVSVKQGAEMLETFFTTQIFPKAPGNEDQFWESRGLSPGDWNGLTSQLYSELFSVGILTPLDHTDLSFKLEVHPQLDLARYSDMVQRAQTGIGDPDLLGAVYAPKGNIQINSPYLEISAFNPRSKSNVTTRKSEKRDLAANTLSLSQKKNSSALKWMPWKTEYNVYTPEKLLIPLPIPHPSHTAVIIYNRDAHTPIPLESDICQTILKGIEESNSPVCEDGVTAFYNSEQGETASSCSETGESVDETNYDQVNRSSYHWTLSSDWTERRANTGTVKVDLASPEDVALDTDNAHVVFSSFGTSV